MEPTFRGPKQTGTKNATELGRRELLKGALLLTRQKNSRELEESGGPFFYFLTGTLSAPVWSHKVGPKGKMELEKQVCVWERLVSEYEGRSCAPFPVPPKKKPRGKLRLCTVNTVWGPVAGTQQHPRLHQFVGRKETKQKSVSSFRPASRGHWVQLSGAEFRSLLPRLSRVLRFWGLRRLRCRDGPLSWQLREREPLKTSPE